jgi:hypothetical protein
LIDVCIGDLEQPIRGRAVLRGVHGDLRFVRVLLNSFNPSIAICWKGCDYATGRVNEEKGRDEARRMCKRFTTESMAT